MFTKHMLNLYSGERFWKDAFSVTVYSGYVWTQDQSKEEKNLRFLNKTDTCRRSLNPSIEVGL